MRITAAIVLILLALVAGGFFDGHRAVAATEDGAPVSTKPMSCVSVTLTGGENYVSPYAVPVDECVVGGSGSNAMWLYGGQDWANGKDGSDPINGGDSQDVIYGGKEGDALHGEGGPDFLYAGCPGGCDQSGNKYFNFIHGEGGDDVIGMANNRPDDVADCGAGYDKVYFDKGIDTVQGDCEVKVAQ